MMSAALAPSPRALRERSAYGDAREATLTPRQAEYRLFARVTHRMSGAAGALERNERGAYARLLEALHDNFRLWLGLALDLSGDGNALPDKLRADLISLAGFVEARTCALVTDGAEAAATAQVLIDINLSVMKGLRGGREES